MKRERELRKVRRSVADIMDAVSWDYTPDPKHKVRQLSAEEYFDHFPWRGNGLDEPRQATDQKTKEPAGESTGTAGSTSQPRPGTSGASRRKSG